MGAKFTIEDDDLDLGKNNNSYIDIVKKFKYQDEDPEPYKTNTSPKDPRDFKISESLLIGFDYGEGDEACLTVVRRKRDQLEVVNTYYGEAAIQMYDMLLHKPTTRYI